MSKYLHYLVPYKRWSYFTSYYHIRQEVQTEKSFSSSRCTFYVLCFIILLNSVYNFWLTLHPSLSPSAAMMGFAVFHSNGMPTSMYLVPSASEALSLVYIYLLYFRESTEECKDGKTKNAYLLFQNEPSVLAVEGNSEQKYFLKMNTRQMLLALINFLQIFTLVIDIFCVVSQINVVLFVKRYLWPVEEWTAMEWLQLATAEVIVLLVQVTFFVYLNVVVLVGVLSIVQLVVISGRISKLSSLLLNAERKQQQRNNRNNVNKIYGRFLRKSVACLRLVSGSANDFISRALSAYIWVNSPLSCLLTGLLLIMGDKFDAACYLFTVAFLLQQWIGTFAIHLLVSGVNRQVHKPVRRVMHLLGTPGGPFQSQWFQKQLQPNRSRSYLKDCSTGENTKNFGMHLKLSDYVGAYHVPSEYRYGFTYWGFQSIVTMMSFSEFVLLYTQFLMYSYKLYTANEFLGFEL